MWQRFLKDYFSFSSSDRNGIVILISLIFLIIILTFLLPGLGFRGNKSDVVDFKEIAAKFYSSEIISEEVVPSPLFELFYFDPNQLTEEQMRKLGFNSSLIKTFENYLSKKGKFREKEDVLKIYGMTDSTYRLIEPFIIISQQNEIREKSHQTVEEFPEKLLVEINSADTIKLKLLPGIGSVLSSRIIRYRDLLGGFWQTEQLMEVYGISAELFEKISASLEVDSTLIRKINMNEASFNELLKHPYITYEQAGKISKFLQQNNKIPGPDVLLVNNIIDSVTYMRLRPYLEVKH
jgi:competence protein ComEA